MSRTGTRLGPQTLHFNFDGRQFVGQTGDCLASALLANGVRSLGRSIKYRRPRGLLAMGPEEPNALLTVGTWPALIPNVSAPQWPLTADLRLQSQNRPASRWLNPAWALRAAHSLLGAGFYYKTFIWPSWRAYEARIRAMAGLGAAPAASILGTTIEYLHCDVLVAGAGAAGLAAARSAARAGATVVLCERESHCGGELEFEAATIEGKSAATWVAATLAELHARGARLLARTALVGGSNGLLVAHTADATRSCICKIRPRSLVVAIGAIERPIAFVDNDLPGVMLLGAAERLLACYGVGGRQEVVLFGNHDRLYVAALRLRGGAVVVRAVVDTRDEECIHTAPLTAQRREQLRRAGVTCYANHTVLAALGRGSLQGVRIAPREQPLATRDLACQGLLVSGGWSPMLQPLLQEGGTAQYLAPLAAFVANQQPLWRAGAGACNGQLELSAALTDGQHCGENAARAALASRSAAARLQDTGPSSPAPMPVAEDDGAPRLQPYWRSPATTADESRQFVDLQNDVTVADLRAALAEGYSDIEHVKRFTTLGVGTEQGRTSGVLGAAILAELRGVPAATVGVSRLRQPYQPLSLASIAGLRVGEQLRLTRRTDLHDWHLANHGVMEASGLWLRPRYYQSHGGDAAAAGIAEATQVRAHGGFLDASTLGKIEVAGADAAALLDQLYLTRASTLSIGRARYMVNLREDGMVLDDGMVLRLAAERFVLTTSSSHAEHMLSHIEHYRALRWHGRQIAIADVGDSRAVVAVAGPRSRDTLAQVLDGSWSAPLHSLRHMQFAEGHYQGLALRLLRASYSGELAYELHCQPQAARPLCEALAAAGLIPFGLEALDILRLEKGYLGHTEINGQTTPFDLNLEAMLRQDNDCIGRALLGRAAFHEPQRPRLVGLRAADGRAPFLAGSQLVPASARGTQRALGYVTSSAYSPALGEWIGLALLARTHSALDTRLIASDPLRGNQTSVRVTPSVHFDPDSSRMKA